MKRHVITKSRSLLKKLEKKMTTLLLDDALKKSDIVAFVQPIFKGKNLILSGVEVLLRLHDESGYHSPEKIIRDLEVSARINDITCSLMKEVAQAFTEHKSQLPSGFTISFNLRADQLKNHRVRSCIQAFNACFAGVAVLTIEIVERDFIDLDKELCGWIKVLHDAGISFALDDFGAGSSSFRYIEKAFFQSLKLDREITGCDFLKMEYQHILTSLSELSAKIGFTIIAEGIENEEQIKRLSRLGINTFQGFHLSHPMDINDFIKRYLQS